MVDDTAWFRINLSREEYAGGEADVIEGAFRQIYVARNAPPGMAMLGRLERDGSYRIYFTPGSLPHARGLFQAYPVIPDDRPSGQRLQLRVGDAVQALAFTREF